mgnify:CR=1 FL=1
MRNQEKIFVIGHKNPDTDSICSAIAYANLKREITGNDYIAKRAGQINEETHYVLQKFGVKVPNLLENVKLQVKDMDIHQIDGVGPNVSLKDTWTKMKENNIKTLPILRDEELLGVISTGDIATSYMDVYDNMILSKARTQYRNIMNTLDGEMVTGNEHGYFTKGKVAIGASSPELMQEFIEKDDLVILGNRVESQMCALDIDVSCMVVCQNDPISENILHQAEEKEIVVIWTQHDTFTAAQHISQSIPVRSFMTKDHLVTFRKNDYVDDVKEVMARKRFRDFPVVDEDGKFLGLVSRRRLLNVSKKQVILVDHNEKNQAVDGVEEADVQEIIDHHRLSSIETIGPVFFRNQPVGCTATIVSQMYEENGVEIDPVNAGLLCSAIISDTLMFRSPTCTPLDESTAKKLAEIAGINIEKLAQAMFKAGSNLKGKTAEEILFLDFKQFTVNDTVFGVGQVNSMSEEELEEIKATVLPEMEKTRQNHSLDMIFFMLTNIIAESSELICSGNEAREKIIGAYDLEDNAQKLMLKGVVSRKKQLVPALVSALQQ